MTTLAILVSVIDLPFPYFPLFYTQVVTTLAILVSVVLVGLILVLLYKRNLLGRQKREAASSNFSDASTVWNFYYVSPTGNAMCLMVSQFYLLVLEKPTLDVRDNRSFI